MICGKLRPFSQNCNFCHRSDAIWTVCITHLLRAASTQILIAREPWRKLNKREWLILPLVFHSFFHRKNSCTELTCGTLFGNENREQNLKFCSLSVEIARIYFAGVLTAGRGVVERGAADAGVAGVAGAATPACALYASITARVTSVFSAAHRTLLCCPLTSSNRV